MEEKCFRVNLPLTLIKHCGSCWVLKLKERLHTASGHRHSLNLASAVNAMKNMYVSYRHDGKVSTWIDEIDFILFCQPFLKEFVKNVEKASSLKSEPLRKIRYRDDKINKKSITKKKATCSIHTKINPCYKFFLSRLYFYPLAGSEKSVHCCFVELKWFVGISNTKET